MTWRVHSQVAWVEDEVGQLIAVMRLPGGSPIALQGVAGVIFADIADGLDPVTEAVARWGDESDDIATTVRGFVDELAANGIVEQGAPRRAVVPSGEDDDSQDMPGPHDLKPYRVLFVCTGNICRSAYAQVVAAAAPIDGVEFTSAGTHAVVGARIDPPMARLVPRGVDPSGHVARQLTRDIATSADLIIAMSDRHRRYIMDEWPALAPRTFLIGQVARELDGLTMSGAGLADMAPHLWQHRSSQPGDAVPDPYGRGPEAARAASQQIDSHLNAILGAIGRLATRRT
ncbi:hypothetical protein ACQCX5_09740 [Propionibacteriaceae bacterium G57]|uniref:arsenate reductase/protein-tyrosine-phosphatase family protein n=1 Tax=Aestuariimicrobium sp. G57 TaxID=3418485 RepID=UPI003DA766C6